jgi:hypothetical protein
VRDLLWLTRYGPEGASSRYRAYQFESGLQRAGWRSTYEPLAPLRSSPADRLTGIARRARRLRSLTGDRGHDAVVVQKEPIMPPALHRIPGLLRAGGPPVVWDVDDAVWIGRRGARASAVEMCRRADLVVAGNALIAEWADRHGARSVAVIPTCFEPPTEPAAGSLHDGVRLVWVGSPATAALLAPYGTALRVALESVPDLTFELIGGEPPAEIRDHPRVATTPWSPETEHAGLSSADYGLAFQPRDEYADHKCGFKIVQYLAYGIVPIATDNPVHRDIVGDVGELIAGPDARSLTDVLAARPSDECREVAMRRWRDRFSRDRAVSGWASALSGLVNDDER